MTSAPGRVLSVLKQGDPIVGEAPHDSPCHGDGTGWTSVAHHRVVKKDTPTTEIPPGALDYEVLVGDARPMTDWPRIAETDAAGMCTQLIKQAPVIPALEAALRRLRP